MADLNVHQRRMLHSVRFAPRELPYANPSMNQLRKLGLVDGAPLTRKDGRLSINYRWSITEAGIAADVA